MLLVTGPVADFFRFIQVLCWISLPVLVSSVLLTYYFHYRKRKRLVAASEADAQLTLAFPRQLGYTNGNGEYVLFDHTDLMRQYRNKLSYNHARNTALQYDLSAIESKYAALAKYAQTHFLTFKQRPMQNFELPAPLQADINKLAEEEASERRTLVNKVMQLERLVTRLEQENSLLREQSTLQTATEDEKTTIITRWNKDYSALKDKIDEQEYLQDVVEEKKAQVNFLQNQLEQRIKNLYQSEHQRLHAVNELKEARAEHEKIKSELLLKQEQVDKSQVIICEKEDRLTEQQRILNEKSAHIATLETLLGEAKEQNEQLNKTLAAQKEMVSLAERQLSDQHSKLELLGNELSANRQILRKIYSDFTALIKANEADESPVIAMRTEYVGNQTEGLAIQ